MKKKKIINYNSKPLDMWHVISYAMCHVVVDNVSKLKGQLSVWKEEFSAIYITLLQSQTKQGLGDQNLFATYASSSRLFF